jgi:hypothetical protein
MVTIIGRKSTRKTLTPPARKLPKITGFARQGGPVGRRGPAGRGTKIEQTDAPGVAPQLGALITLPEWFTYHYLWKRKRLEPGRDFIFQSSLEGGRQELGGLVLDFELPGRIGARGLVINVQGEYWHRFRQSNRAKDLLDKIRLVNLGYAVVYVNEDDVIRSVSHTIEKALVGEQLFEDTEFG